MNNPPPPHDYLKFESGQFMKQLCVDWNIESVAHLPSWIRAYPTILELSKQADQPNPFHSDINLKVKAEMIRFPTSTPTVTSDARSKIATEFQQLSQKWKHDTRGVSSVSEIVMHPAYQTILGLGKEVLPDILHELQKNGGHWFHALYYLAGQHDAAAGTKTVADATAAWIEWGYKNNYI